MDPHCRANAVVGGTQRECYLLLCNFHTKKTWVKNLLPKVYENKKDELYKAMCILMDAKTKIELKKQ